MDKRPPRDADATRQRLLSAAGAEFARYGIAGARVDRIAAASRSNKAQIYHYFSSKDGLFDAVFATMVEDVLREVPMDVRELPEYAGRLFDGYQQHPQVHRLATWHRLERGDEGLIEAVLTSNAAKIQAIAAAQRDGLVADTYPAEVVLGLILHMAALWASQTPEYLHQTAHLQDHQRRSVVVSAVERLTAPTKPAAPPTSSR